MRERGIGKDRMIEDEKKKVDRRSGVGRTE